MDIEEGNGGFPFRQAVFEDQSGDAVLFEPLGDAGAFRLDGEHAVSPARADDHGGSAGMLRLINGEGGGGRRRGAIPVRRVLVRPHGDAERLGMGKSGQGSEKEKGAAEKMDLHGGEMGL